MSKQTYNGHHDVASSAQLITGTTAWQGSLNTYDSQGNLSASTDGRGVSVASDGSSVTANAQAAQYTAHQLYNPQGDQTAAGTPPITTTLGGVTSASTPVTTTTGYDSDGNPTSSTTPNGNSTTMVYDHLGRQTSTTLPPVTLSSGSIVQPVQSTAYDGEDHLVRQVNGNGDTTQSSYDPLGRLVASVNPVSGTQINTYNATELTATQDPVGNTSHYTYDPAGRLTQVTDPLTGTALYQYDPAGNTTVITSGDTSGGVIQVQTQQYDSRNQLTSATVTGPDGATATTQMGYDQDGNATYQQAPNGDATLSIYDKADRALSVQLVPTGSSTSGPQETYSYDAANNMTRAVDMDGRTSSMVYDGDARLTQGVDVVTAPTGTTMITTSTSYDPNGNGLSHTTLTADTTTPGVVATHSLTATYNAADWVVSNSDDGLITSYGYDAAGQQRSHTIGSGASPVSMTLDPEGRATSISEAGGTFATTIGYTLNDQVSTISLPGGVGQGAGYDKVGRVLTVTATGPTTGLTTTTLASGYSYGYTPIGWTARVTASVTGGASGATYTQVITHDALGRLSAQTGGPDGPEAWTYDANGNIRTHTQGSLTTVMTYSTDAPNELLYQHTLTTTRGTETRTYDQRGNTTSLVSDDQPRSSQFALDTHLGYDAQGRPVTITVMDHACSEQTTTATFGYNAAGQRNRYVVTPPAGCPQLQRNETYQYRGGDLAQAVVISGTATGTTSYTDTYIYNQAGNPLELLRVTAPSATPVRYWYVLDGRGNVVALTDVTGAVVNRYSYDLWGEPATTQESAQLHQPLRYAGYWYDEKLGWYWLDGRSYEPEGHLLQPDPSMADGTRSYVYAADNPVDLWDAGGSLAACHLDWWGIGGALQAACAVGRVGRDAVITVYDVAAGDDIKVLRDPQASPQAKLAAAADLALYLVPGPDLIKGPEFLAKGVAKIAEKLGVRLPYDALKAAITDKLATRFGKTVVKACAACFAADTLVATPDGLQPIQRLHVGQLVLSEDPQTGKVEAEPVQAVLADPVSPLLAVELRDGSVITVTADHPFWVDSGLRFVGPGWLEAGQLHPGDHIRSARGVDAVVVGLRYHVGRAAVYTLTVAKDHTFFVGTARVLVHNTNCFKITPEQLGIPANILKQFKVTGHLVGDVLVVDFDVIEVAEGQTIRSPLAILRNLMTIAREQGAKQLRIETTFANERLMDVVVRRLAGHVRSEGGREVVDIPIPLHD